MGIFKTSSEKTCGSNKWNQNQIFEYLEKNDNKNTMYQTPWIPFKGSFTCVEWLLKSLGLLIFLEYTKLILEREAKKRYDCDFQHNRIRCLENSWSFWETWMMVYVLRFFFFWCINIKHYCIFLSDCLSCSQLVLPSHPPQFQSCCKPCTELKLWPFLPFLDFCICLALCCPFPHVPAWALLWAVFLSALGGVVPSLAHF